VDEVRRLKASDGPALHIWGGSELLQTLIAAALIDEYYTWVSPLVLGEGKRLCDNGVPPRALALVETRSTFKGILINTYHEPMLCESVASPPAIQVVTSGRSTTGSPRAATPAISRRPKPYSTTSATSLVRLRISPDRNIGRRSHP
jgi:hypothetical protein